MHRKKRKKETRPRIRNNNDFIKRVYELVGDEYTFLEPYQGSKTKIRVRHNICGNEYDVAPNNFLSGSRCTKEKSQRIREGERLSNSTFLKRVQNLVGDSYIFLQDYSDAHTRLAYYHVDCGKVHYINPNNFSNGQRCPGCATTLIMLDKWYKAKQRFYKKIAGQYKVLSPYVDTQYPIKLLHLLGDGDTHIWDTIPNRVLIGYGCGICAHQCNYDTNAIKKRIKKLVGDEYTLASDYRDATTKVNIVHNKCGYKDWWVLPNDFFHGSRCPRCNASSGELMIMNRLLQNRIDFVYQKRFTDCKYKQPLPFDFYLPSYNVCIEYDGLQHFKQIAYFSSDGGLKRRKKRDFIKTKYCQDKHIGLLRIPYTINNEREIEKIILDFLDKKG